MNAVNLNSLISVSSGFCTGIRAQLARSDHILIGQPAQINAVHDDLDSFEAKKIGPADLFGRLSRISARNMCAELGSLMPDRLIQQELYPNSPEIENLGSLARQFPNVDPSRPGYMGTRLWKNAFSPGPATNRELQQNFMALALFLTAMEPYLDINHPWGLSICVERKIDGTPLSAQAEESWNGFLQEQKGKSYSTDIVRQKYDVGFYRHFDLLDPLLILSMNAFLRGPNAFQALLTTFEPDQISPEASSETDLTPQECVKELVLSDTRPLEVCFIKRPGIKIHRQGSLHPAVILTHDLFHLITQHKQSQELKNLKIKMNEIAVKSAGQGNPWLAATLTAIWDAPMLTAAEHPVSLGLASARILGDIGFFARDVVSAFDQYNNIRADYHVAWQDFAAAFCGLIRQEYSQASFYPMTQQTAEKTSDHSVEGGIIRLKKNLTYDMRL